MKYLGYNIYSLNTIVLPKNNLTCEKIGFNYAHFLILAKNTNIQFIIPKLYAIVLVTHFSKKKKKRKKKKLTLSNSFL